MSELPPGFEQFKARALRAFEEYTGGLTRWAGPARQGRVGDLEEMRRRYELGRRGAEEAITAVLERMAAVEGE